MNIEFKYGIMLDETVMHLWDVSQIVSLRLNGNHVVIDEVPFFLGLGKTDKLVIAYELKSRNIFKITVSCKHPNIILQKNVNMPIKVYGGKNEGSLVERTWENNQIPFDWDSFFNIHLPE